MTTIKDVSEAAGVSVATVSRTLRTPEKVSAEMRERVLKAVADTNYQPNYLAQRFRTKRSNAIMVLVSTLRNAFYARVISGIQRVAEEKKYTVLLGETGDRIDVEEKYAAFAATKQVEGVIQLSDRLPAPIRPLLEAEEPFPYVNACEFSGMLPYPTVGIDNRLASAEITSHLLKAGHTDIAVITGPSTNPVSRERLAGVRDARARRGLEAGPMPIIEGDFTVGSGALCADIALAQPQAFTALICFNDAMAIGAMHTLKRRGISIPDDVSVVGFDDIEFARYADPPLTTMSQPTVSIGQTAAHILFDRIEGGPASATEVRLPTDLIVRDSSRALRREK